MDPKFGHFRNSNPVMACSKKFPKIAKETGYLISISDPKVGGFRNSVSFRFS